MRSKARDDDASAPAGELQASGKASNEGQEEGGQAAPAESAQLKGHMEVEVEVEAPASREAQPEKRLTLLYQLEGMLRNPTDV